MTKQTMKPPKPQARIEIPPKLLPVFQPVRGEVRWRAAYGGRGSGKSRTFAIMAAVWGVVERLRILCTREFQVSIRESFHAELRQAIENVPWLAAHYDVGVDYIRGRNGTEFLFRGLRTNISAIKSMADIDLCIVEEAEDVPESSWLALEPTIRAPRSEIWAIWNPASKGSPIDQRLRLHPPPRALVAEVNWRDNPWFPAVLDEQRKQAQARWDDALYRHIWEGAYLEHTDALVYGGRFVVDAFEPPKTGWAGPYAGLDFGFSADPTAAVLAWVGGDTLYIEREAGKVGLGLDATAPYIRERIPGFEALRIRADSARPESIDYLRRHGLPGIVACVKGKGSVEDGVEHIRSFRRIVVHPRCTETLAEFRAYSHRIDRFTGEILPEIIDANNHYLDALRYALEPVRKSVGRDFRAML